LFDFGDLPADWAPPVPGVPVSEHLLGLLGLPLGDPTAAPAIRRVGFQLSRIQQVIEHVRGKGQPGSLELQHADVESKRRDLTAKLFELAAAEGSAPEGLELSEGQLLRSPAPDSPTRVRVASDLRFVPGLVGRHHLVEANPAATLLSEFDEDEWRVLDEDQDEALQRIDGLLQQLSECLDGLDEGARGAIKDSGMPAGRAHHPYADAEERTYTPGLYPWQHRHRDWQEAVEGLRGLRHGVEWALAGKKRLPGGQPPHRTQDHVMVAARDLYIWTYGWASRTTPTLLTQDARPYPSLAPDLEAGDQVARAYARERFRAVVARRLPEVAVEVGEHVGVSIRRSVAEKRYRGVPIPTPFDEAIT